jgi:hypothetical protein
MQFTVDGEKYVYDGKLMLPEAIAIQKATGWTKNDWMEQLGKGDVIAEAALFWVLRKRRYPDQPIEFAEMNYDTNGTDLTYLKRDGSPVDMEAVAARVQELQADNPDLAREKALTQALDELDPEPEPQEFVDPPAGGSIAAAEPALTTSTGSPPPTLLPSPITTASVPGSSTG